MNKGQKKILCIFCFILAVCLAVALCFDINRRTNWGFDEQRYRNVEGIGRVSDYKIDNDFGDVIELVVRSEKFYLSVILIGVSLFVKPTKPGKL